MQHNVSLKKNSGIYFHHTRTRFRQRYGRDLSFLEFNQMNQMIREQKATFLRKQSNTKTHFLIGEIVVVYDKARNSICTVLPKDSIKQYRKE